MNKEKSKKSSLKILIVIILAIVMIIGGFFGAKLIYQNGFNAGRENFKQEAETELNNLGTAVSEKSEFSNLVKENLEDIPDEADEDDFEDYLEKLEKIISETSSEDIKNELKKYKTTVSEFIEFYAESDNNAQISERYSEIKTKANELSKNLTNTFNQKIKNAIEKLTN